MLGNWPLGAVVTDKDGPIPASGWRVSVSCWALAAEQNVGGMRACSILTLLSCRHVACPQKINCGRVQGFGKKAGMRAGMCGTMQRRGFRCWPVGFSHLQGRPGQQRICCGLSRQQMRGVRDSHVASLSLINEETKAHDWPRVARDEASEPVRCDQWTTQRPGFRRVRAPRRQPSTFTRRIPPPRSHTACHRHRIPAAQVSQRHLSRREWHVSICNYDAWIHSMAQQITGIRARADVVGRRANLGGRRSRGGGGRWLSGAAAVQQCSNPHRFPLSPATPWPSEPGLLSVGPTLTDPPRSYRPLAKNQIRPEGEHGS